MSNFNTSGLLQALDRIKPDLKPLPQHFITSQDQHTRELYATLLAAVLLSGGQVSEPQSRLFGMLLQSMQLEPVPARFFELAQQLDAGQLKGAIRGIQPIKDSFSVDMLILARLSPPLHQQQLQLIAELFDVLDIGHEVTVLADAAAFALGLSDKSQSSRINYSLVIKSPILKETCNFSEVWTDLGTGLMWSCICIGQQWVDRQAKGQANRGSWEAAQKMCREFRLADFDDWRLPTKEELGSLMIAGEAGHLALDEIFFSPDLSSPKDFGTYWSASSYESHGAFAWAASFDKGYFLHDHKTNYNSVRAVRSIR